MAIVTKKFEDVATLKLLDDLREILLNDHELNLSFIKSKGWAYAQRDDHQLLEEDSVYLEQAFINLSQNKIYAVWVDAVLSKKNSEINIQEINRFLS